MTQQIEKEFEAAFLKQDAEWKAEYGKPVKEAHIEAVRFAFKAGFLAAATPRDEVIRELRDALKLCADDLEAEVNHHYGETKTHPALAGKYEQDMEPVLQARAALSRAKLIVGE